MVKTITQNISEFIALLPGDCKINRIAVSKDKIDEFLLHVDSEVFDPKISDVDKLAGVLGMYKGIPVCLAHGYFNIKFVATVEVI